MFSETNKMTPPQGSAHDHVRQLQKKAEDLTKVLQGQQEVLRSRGMSLPSTALVSLEDLQQRLKRFADQTQTVSQTLLQLRALAETTALISSSLDTGEVLNQVMDTVIHLCGAERGYIVLRDRRSGGLEFTVARGIDRDQPGGEPFTISSTIVNEVATTGLPVLTDNASNDPRFLGNASVVGFALRSIIAVPLKTRGEVIGVVYCDNRFMKGVFKQQEMELVAAFANQAAVAIENARLFESARSRLTEIKETSDLISNVLESITSGVITIDREGIISTCNAAAEAIISVDSQEVLGKSLFDVLPPGLNGDFQERLQRVRETGSQELIQAELLVDGRGKRTWYMIISPLRDHDGATQGAAIVLDDMTADKLREEQFREVRRYVTPGLLDRMRSSDLSGQELVISVLSSDVRGFTSFSEHLEPEELMKIINQYLSTACDAIDFQEGVVGKYLGDAVTGLFNTQLNPQDDHALRAVRAAMNMRSDVHALHDLLPREQQLLYGIGVHSGPAVVGNVGSPQRKDFAVIGDALDLSKLLQENARGGEVLISEATYELVAGHFECEPVTLDPAKLKGHTQLTTAYRVLRAKKRTAPISLDDF